ncbi:MAG: hypothetical protein GX630_05815 [Actinobacteria bacterium]|nr:hypothetical protein [Actinomycetota bacterium]
MDDDDFDDLETSYEVLGQRTPSFGIVVPVIVLLVVIAVVAGLVWGGVIHGDEARTGPEQAPTTEPTVLIVP